METAFSHSPNRFIFDNNLFPHLGGPMNDLAPMKNCSGVQGRSNKSQTMSVSVKKSYEKAYRTVP